MSSATLTQCINRISAIAIALQQTHSDAIALEFQHCLDILTAELCALKQYADQLETANQKLEVTLEELRHGNKELIAARQETEQQIRFHSRLLDTVEQAVIATDLQGNITYWNRFAEVLYGWTTDEVLGRSILEVTPASTTQAEATEIFACLQAGQSWSGEFLVQRRDGTTFPIMITDSPIYDEQAILSGIVGISMDITERQQAETALRKSEQQFRLLAENIRDIFWIYSADLQLLYISPAYEEIWGESCESLYTHSDTWLDRIHRDDRDRIISLLPQLNQQNLTYEYRIIRGDGSQRWIRMRTFLVSDEQGNVYRIVGIGEDISDAYQQAALRQQAEEKLRQTQQHLQAILDNSPTAIYVIDRENKHLLVNRSYEALVSTPQENLIGKSIYEVWLPEFADGFAVNNRRILQSGKPIEFEEAAPLSDGVHTYITTKFPLYDSQGFPYAVCGISTDISDRKKAEKQLQASQRFIQKIVDSSPNILYLYDLEEQRNIYVNREITQRLGYTPEEIKEMGQNFLSGLMHPDDQLAALEQIKTIEVACDGEVVEMEYRMRHKTGEWRWLHSWDTVFLRRSDGKPKQILGTATDISDRKQAEEQLQASLREKEVLLREIHHRVKNNLQVIHSLLRLQSSYTDEPKILQMFQESQNRIRSMALIHELLYRSQDLARIDFGSYLHTLVNQLARTYTLSTNALSWDIDIQPAHIELGIDTALPCGLLINELVSNALKYAFPQGQAGQIRISLQACNNEEFTLVISDNGVGIPTTVDFRNTNSLGLQLVCGTTEQIGGTLELDRTQGTTFTLKFKEVKYKSRS